MAKARSAIAIRGHMHGQANTLQYDDDERLLLHRISCADRGNGGFDDGTLLVTEHWGDLLKGKGPCTPPWDKGEMRIESSHSVFRVRSGP